MSKKKKNNRPQKPVDNTSEIPVDGDKIVKISIGIIVALLVIVMIFLLSSNSSSTSKPLNDEILQNQDDVAEEVVDYVVTNTGTIILEDGQQMKFELYGEIAPITVENFVNLANEGFYDGLIFHRVIENFVIQGGDPTGTGMGGSGTNIKGEFSTNGVENPILHERGVLSMARSADMDSASSQFFIIHEKSQHLDGSYAGFGKVIDGLDVIDNIATVETVGEDKPLVDVVISTIIID